MFTPTVFGIVLFEGMSVLEHVEQFPWSEGLNFLWKNQRKCSAFFVIASKMISLYDEEVGNDFKLF